MKVYTDWNCQLLPNMGNLIADPADSAKALQTLWSRFGIRRFYAMPEFDCRAESVSLFLLRRDRSVRSTLEHLDPDIPIRLYAAGAALLVPGLSDVPSLQKLYPPNVPYLPVLFPLSADVDRIFPELNRMLYHTEHRLLLLSFDLYSLFYPPHIIEQLLRLPNTAYQFSYKCLQKPEWLDVLKKLLYRRAPILFGTSLNSANKACYFDFDGCIRSASAVLSRFELEDLLFNRRIFRKATSP